MGVVVIAVVLSMRSKLDHEYRCGFVTAQKGLGVLSSCSSWNIVRLKEALEFAEGPPKTLREPQ